MRLRFIALACLWHRRGVRERAAWAQDDFYKGKQLRLVVSTDAGGAYDTYARLVSQIIEGAHPGQSDHHRAEHARSQRAQGRELHRDAPHRATAPSSRRRMRAS